MPVAIGHEKNRPVPCSLVAERGILASLPLPGTHAALRQATVRVLYAKCILSECQTEGGRWRGGCRERSGVRGRGSGGLIVDSADVTVADDAVAVRDEEEALTGAAQEGVGAGGGAVAQHYEPVGVVA